MYPYCFFNSQYWFVALAAEAIKPGATLQEKARLLQRAGPRPDDPHDAPSAGSLCREAVARLSGVVPGGETPGPTAAMDCIASAYLQLGLSQQQRPGCAEVR
jgi:hypothetical protein